MDIGSLIGILFIAGFCLAVGLMCGWWKGFCHGRTYNITYNIPKVDKLILNGEVKFYNAALKDNEKSGTANEN